MSSWAHQVHPALAPYVAQCVGYDFWLDPDAVHFGLPSTSITVVISFDEPLDCTWLNQPTSQPGQQFWRLATGLHDQPALIRTHGRQHGVQLSLTPLGARRLLGAPTAAISGDLVEHDDLPLGVPAHLHERLSKLGWDRRFEVLQQHLLDVLHGTDDARHEIKPELQEAWRVLCETGGRARIERVAEHVGWSRRHLATQFRHEFGMSPKRLARVARFEAASSLIDSGVALAAAAARAGYADQAHLHRDWRALAGQTPTQAVEEFPILQALTP